MEAKKSGWEYEAAYNLLDLYVRELIERKEKKMLDLEGMVEAYLYVLGRLKSGEAEIDEIAEMIEKEIEIKPGAEEDTGLSDAIGGRKLKAGLLEALEGQK